LNRVLFQPAAAAELDEAYRWYERERAGLGERATTASEATDGIRWCAKIPDPTAIASR